MCSIRNLLARVPYYPKYANMPTLLLLILLVGAGLPAFWILKASCHFAELLYAPTMRVGVTSQSVTLWTVDAAMASVGLYFKLIALGCINALCARYYS